MPLPRSLEDQRAETAPRPRVAKPATVSGHMACSDGFTVTDCGLETDFSGD